MAAKINWRRYGTKLRHCHPVYKLYHCRHRYYSVNGREARGIVMSVSVCLSVRKHISGATRPKANFFYASCLCLDRPLAALRYVMYFRFYG